VTVVRTAELTVVPLTVVPVTVARTVAPTAAPE
jgi:hypothetical protein